MQKFWWSPWDCEWVTDGKQPGDSWKNTSVHMGKNYLLSFVRIGHGFLRQLTFYYLIGTHGQKEKSNSMARTTVNRCLLLSNPVRVSPDALCLMLQVWLPRTPKLLIFLQGYLLFKSWFTAISFLAYECKFFTFLSFSSWATLIIPLRKNNNVAKYCFCEHWLVV